MYNFFLKIHKFQKNMDVKNLQEKMILTFYF